MHVKNIKEKLISVLHEKTIRLMQQLLVQKKVILSSSS